MRTKPKARLPATIDAATLAGLCDVTERWLRELGNSGKIPKCVNGAFPTRETLAALFKHFRRDTEAIQTERLLRMTATRKLSEHTLAEVEAKYYDRQEVARACAGLGLKIRASLIRALTHDFPLRVQAGAPAELKGIARSAADSIGKEAVNAALEHLRQELDALGYSESPEQPPAS